MAIQRINLGTAPSGTGGDTNRSAFTKIDGNFADTTNAASRLVGTADGNVMEVGAFGLGGKIVLSAPNTYNDLAESELSVNRFITFGNSFGYPTGLSFVGFGDRRNFFGFTAFGQAPTFITLESASVAAGSRNITQHYFWTTKNATKDSNGFLKESSPIVQLYTDKIELNDEAKLQKITFEKLGVGDYLVKGSLGFAQEGWYIEMPKDANGNVLVAVVYEQLENNDISVKTYDYMLNKKGRIVPDLETPLDIPSTRWIDLRLQALPQPDIKPFSTDETVATNAE
ncbi:hypothetical protein A9Z61_04120 [Moraxella osloensis]|nr:hypothetical protein [Moraxella osloensis]OBX58518.1 hypothetical protein A9Z61_04120 [Moraxella osloensis]